MRARSPLVAAAIGSLALLAACSSAPATRLYTLAAVAEVPAAKPQPAGKPLTLVVTDVRLPQYLDRSQIVTRGGDHRLRIAEFDQWGGNLRDEMMRVLAENLGRLLPGSRVIAAPSPVPLQPDYRLALDLHRFELDADGRVRLAGRWWLTRGSDGAAVAAEDVSFAGAAVGSSSYDAVVGAMSAVYGELARSVARGLPAPEARGS